MFQNLQPESAGFESVWKMRPLLGISETVHSVMATVELTLSLFYGNSICGLPKLSFEFYSSYRWWLSNAETLHHLQFLTKHDKTVCELPSSSDIPASKFKGPFSQLPICSTSKLHEGQRGRRWILWSDSAFPLTLLMLRSLSNKCDDWFSPLLQGLGRSQKTLMATVVFVAPGIRLRKTADTL